MRRIEFEHEGAPRPAYRIDITPKAENQISDAFSWYFERAPDFASRWYHGLLSAISELAIHPEAHPVAAESAILGQPLRRLLYRQRRTAYHVFYSIVLPGMENENGTIRIIRVRNAVMRPLGESTDEEIDEPDEL